MRLTKFLNENDFEFLENCQNYIKELKSTNFSKILYRGSKNSYELGQEIKVRNDRISRDSSKELHAYLDKLYKEATGIPLRSSSLFCSLSESSVKQYGEPYIVVPKGSYKLFMHNDIVDAYDNLESNIVDNFNINPNTFIDNVMLPFYKLNSQVANKIEDVLSIDIALDIENRAKENPKNLKYRAYKCFNIKNLIIPNNEYVMNKTNAFSPLILPCLKKIWKITSSWIKEIKEVSLAKTKSPNEIYCVCDSYYMILMRKEKFIEKVQTLFEG